MFLARQRWYQQRGMLLDISKGNNAVIGISGPPEGRVPQGLWRCCASRKGTDPMDQDPTLSVETRLATDLAGRVIIQRIKETGH